MSGRVRRESGRKVVDLEVELEDESKIVKKEGRAAHVLIPAS